LIKTLYVSFQESATELVEKATSFGWELAPGPSA
jgi:KaiC/GvpD/RAD55 family RecA-like ATPase